MDIAEIGVTIAATRRCTDRDKHGVGFGDRIISMVVPVSWRGETSSQAVKRAKAKA